MTTTEIAHDLLKDQEFLSLVKSAHDCLKCGKCSGSCPMMELFPEYFNPHHLLEKLIMHPGEALRSIDIWFCASCYRCNKHCPQGIELPDIFVKLRKKALTEDGAGKMSQAVEIIKERIPFFNSFFRVCYHPERIPLNDPLVKNLLADKHKKLDRKVTQDSGKKIAVVGSGPAGLYLAWLMRKQGHSVTIFESEEKAGGMLRRCIPEYRIPSADIDKDIKGIKKMGIEIRTRTPIGKKTNIRNLKIRYDAIFLATGAHQITRLNIPGEDLPGVYGSLEFLEKLKQGEFRESSMKRTVVIGGGNTAMDVASTIKKTGVKEVILLYRRTRKEMPADINEIAEVEKDGVEIQQLVAPVGFSGQDRLEVIECRKMELGPPDHTGRMRPLPVKDSNFTMEVDLAVNAVGEKPTTDFLPDLVAINRDGSIATDPMTMETSMEGVFAGGDVVLGSATVSEAIVNAYRAAFGIETYLQKS